MLEGHASHFSLMKILYQSSKQHREEGPLESAYWEPLKLWNQTGLPILLKLTGIIVDKLFEKNNGLKYT